MSKYNLKFFTVVIGATLAALLGGTTNSLNSLSTALSNDLRLSDSTYQLLASLALIGLYFAIPAGFVIHLHIVFYVSKLTLIVRSACFDRFGAFKTAVGGTVLHGLSFLAASYCGKTTFGNVLLGAALLGCGFGAGKCTS